MQTELGVSSWPVSVVGTRAVITVRERSSGQWTSVIKQVKSVFQTLAALLTTLVTSHPPLPGSSALTCV